MPSSATAVIVAAEEEVRVLLRGLLRLHNFRVMGEADGESSGLELVRLHSPGLIIVDHQIREGSVGGLLDEARRASRRCRLVFVAPGGTAGASGGKPPREVDAVLERPFTVKAFAEAVAGTAHPT